MDLLEYINGRNSVPVLDYGTMEIGKVSYRNIKFSWETYSHHWRNSPGAPRLCLRFRRYRR